MENVGIFYCHLEYFTAIWYILKPFGNVVVMWYIFHCFGTSCQEKSGNHGDQPIFLQGVLSPKNICRIIANTLVPVFKISMLKPSPPQKPPICRSFLKWLKSKGAELGFTS
jgi:hypothetical protein